MSIDHPGYGEQQRLESELAAAPQQQGTACGDGGVMNVREALELIAAPMRPDGTWNRDREACRQIASEALAAIDAALAEHGEIERLRAERDALRADAERYRWLRDKRLGQHIAYAIRGQNEERDLYDVEADAAIDASRKA